MTGIEHDLTVHVHTSPGGASDVDEIGKQVYTDTSWVIGFAPRWMAAEIERRGIGADRLLFASDEPWGDRAGELARMTAATGDGELARAVLRDNAERLYG